MSASPISIRSPCLQVCQARDGACVACGRTLGEIQQWKTFSPATRDQIIDVELPMRQQLRAAPAPPTGQRLFSADAPRVLGHLCSLSFDDRHWRFGLGMTDEGLRQWVSHLDWQGQWLWHPHTADHAILALVHLAATGKPELWEIGLSVIPGARGQGWGRVLLNQALAQAQTLTPNGTAFLQGAANNAALAALCRHQPSLVRDGERQVCFSLKTPTV